MTQQTVRWRLHAVLLLLWFLVSFGLSFFAHRFQVTIAGWPVGFWFAAQGSVLVFIGITALFAWYVNRREVSPPESGFSVSQFHTDTDRTHRRFGLYVVCLLLVLAALAFAEYLGMPRVWVAAIFLSATLILYAAIGVYGRTSDAFEYYVAGRRVPAVYNGMATAADWMSAASFISLAGSLYLQGYSGTEEQSGGLAYVMGWTGGFCLVALLVAPHLRRMQLNTVPDYFAARFGGRWPRIIAALATILCSFTYVVAQIYGVGLITSRLTGVQFEIGILLGLGGILVCSFLGGMRAVTWTQVAQYVVIILSLLIPVSWLAYKQVGNPLALMAYGQQLAKIEVFEQQFMASPVEQSVIQEYQRRAQEYERKLQDVEKNLQIERKELRRQLREMDGKNADNEYAAGLRRELSNLPKDATSAREIWTQAMQENQARAKRLGGMPPHATPFIDKDSSSETFTQSRRNFLALMFCLMVGTLGLPHLLTRYYTTPSVADTRQSVAWSLFFIALLYLSTPALAVLVKYEVMAHLVGLPFDQLPSWVSQWARDPSLLSVSDVNGDKILQFSELQIGADLLMLATPEIGGLPYIVSVLVAAGGLAAALSTADSLLLTLGNAVAHDLYFEGKTGDRVQAMRRVMWSKFALLVAALIAAYVAAQKPAGILYLVTTSFSLAGAAFAPVMVLGIFWKKTNDVGAIGGMISGLIVTLYYMVINNPTVRSALRLAGDGLWWGIQPISAGVFGVAAGLVTTVLLSLLSQKNRQSAAG